VIEPSSSTGARFGGRSESHHSLHHRAIRGSCAQRDQAPESPLLYQRSTSKTAFPFPTHFVISRLWLVLSAAGIRKRSRGNRRGRDAVSDAMGRPRTETTAALRDGKFPNLARCRRTVTRGALLQLEVLPPLLLRTWRGRGRHPVGDPVKSGITATLPQSAERRHGEKSAETHRRVPDRIGVVGGHSLAERSATAVDAVDGSSPSA
jgi:hypothetical protein